MLSSYYGRGKIWVPNGALSAQLEEVEGPIPSLVLTQYTDESPRIEADHPRSLKSERSSRDIK